MDELRLLKDKILCSCSMSQSEVAAFSPFINAAVLAKSTTELEEIIAQRGRVSRQETTPRLSEACLP